VTAKVGTTANSYEILSKLAEGGMAEIFLARAASGAGMYRHVVLKRVSRERALDTQYVRMFLDEAQLAAQLQHPNIAQVFDIGRLGASYFFTMEYVHGVTVQMLVERATKSNVPLPIGAVLAIVAGAAAGLGHAHQRLGLDGKTLGIVHRDVSPSNLMVSFEGHVKVVDFGVAKAVGRPETQAGEIKGKVAYLSPEQCRQIKVDPRSDLFSLGIVMWEVLTGRRLFKRETAFETMAAIAIEPAPPASTFRPDLPAPIDAIATRLLATDLVDRFQTAEHLIAAVESAALFTKSPMTPVTLARLLRELFGYQPEPWVALEREAVTVIAEPIPPDLAAAVEPESRVEQMLTSQFSSVMPYTPTPQLVVPELDAEPEADEHTRTTNIMLAVSMSQRETRIVPVLAAEEPRFGDPVDPVAKLPMTEDVPTERDPQVPKRTQIRGSTNPRPPTRPPTPNPRPPTRPPDPRPRPSQSALPPAAAPIAAPYGTTPPGFGVTVMGSGPFVPAATMPPTPAPELLAAGAIPASGPRSVLPGMQVVPMPQTIAKEPPRPSLRWWILGGSVLGVALTTVIVIASRPVEPLEIIASDAAPARLAADAAVPIDAAIDAPEVADAVAEVDAAEEADTDAADLTALAALDASARPLEPSRRPAKTRADLVRIYGSRRFNELVTACKELRAEDNRAIVCTVGACRAHDPIAQDWYRNISPRQRDTALTLCNKTGPEIEDVCSDNRAPCRH
jgi:eukaryotic-like serine/threonine-protein kinase